LAFWGNVHDLQKQSKSLRQMLHTDWSKRADGVACPLAAEAGSLGTVLATGQSVAWNQGKPLPWLIRKGIYALVIAPDSDDNRGYSPWIGRNTRFLTFSGHRPAKNWNAVPGNLRGFRLTAAKLILAHVAAGDRGDAVLLTADFNASPGVHSRSLFAGAGLMDSAERAGKPAGKSTFHLYGIGFQCLDGILVSPHWRVHNHLVLDVKPGNAFPSDHFAVLADLALPKEPAAPWIFMFDSLLQRNRGLGFLTAPGLFAAAARTRNRAVRDHKVV
jgi:hypothetical protein